MDKRERILLNDLPELLRTFAYHNMSCSYGDGTTEDNPWIYPEVIFSDWNELADNLNNFLKKIKVGDESK